MAEIFISLDKYETQAAVDTLVLAMIELSSIIIVGSSSMLLRYNAIGKTIIGDHQQYVLSVIWVLRR